MQPMHADAPPPALALKTALEQGPVKPLHVEVIALASAAVILDGFDNQLLGFAIPALIRDWGVTRNAFIPVIGLGLVAMSLGTAVAGWAGDRYGRRPTLIAAVALFGLASLATLSATSVMPFTVFRLLAGLGLGGAMPGAVALLSEYTPHRRRSMTVTLGMICTPLGGVIAGLTAAGLLPHGGWRALFAVGGIAPLLLCVLLLARLPESLALLGRRADGEAGLCAIARRLGHDGPLRDTDGPSGHTAREEELVPGLFDPGVRKDTALIWAAFLCTLTVAYCVFNWLPTLLVSLGFDMAVSSEALAGFNFGGMGGALMGALWIGRAGSRWLTLAAAAGAVASSLLAAAMVDTTTAPVLVVVILTLCGFCVAGLQPMLFAVAAHIYPEASRARGVGLALAVGRLGAMGSSALGSAMIALGAPFYFTALAILMVLCCIAIAGIARHVRPAPLVSGN